MATNHETVESGWDYTPPTGLFLKLQKGPNKLRIMCDAPIRYEVTFEGKAPRMRFALPVVVIPTVKGTEPVFNVFEFGAQIYEALKGLVASDDWGNLTEYDVVITRSGDGLESKYVVTPCPKKPMPQKCSELFADHGTDWVGLATNRSKEQAPKSGSMQEEYDPFAD